MGNSAIIWTFAGVIAAATFTRGHSMTSTLRMFLWYSLGALVLSGASLIWISLEPDILIQHRIVVGVLGALFGALAMLSLAEWIGPAKSQAQIAIPLPPSNSIGTVNNNQGINTQGQIGNNTIINNPVAPANSGVLSPKNTILFSPSGAQPIIPRMQFGTSNTIYSAKEIGRESDVGKLLFPALSEQQFKIELVEGKLKVSTSITDENGKLIAELIQNEWKVSPPPGTWDRNYTEDSLEVKDSLGRIVLQVRALPDRIQLQGMWWVDIGFNGVVRFIIRGNQRDGAQIVLIPKNNKNPLPVIDPMFNYPSELHLGELVTQGQRGDNAMGASK